MTERDAVQQAFDRFGRDAGLEKKSGSWYRQGDDVIAVSSLQRSQYGPSYYWNQAFWLRQLGDERYPKVNKCHLQSRLEGLLPDAEQRVRELLDLEHALSDEDRVAELVALLERELLPVIEQGSSIDGLRRLYEAGKLARAGITGPAQPILAPNDGPEAEA